MRSLIPLAWGWYPDVNADIRGLIGLAVIAGSLALLVWVNWPEKKS